jgi:hypothetical protein
MPPPNPNASPKYGGFGPNLAMMIAVLIILIFACLFLLRPKPPGAIDSGPSPAAAQH